MLLHYITILDYNSIIKNLIDSCTRLRADKSSLSSDEYENNKVSVGNHKELVTRHKKKEAGSNSDGGNLHEEEVETSSQSHHTDDSDESDVVEHDVSINPTFRICLKRIYFC